MKKLVTLLLVAVIAVPFSSVCQNFTYPTVSLKTVSFSNTLTIKKDDGSGNYVTSFQWSSTYTTQGPVAYVSGIAPTVSATFTITCVNKPTSVQIRGTSSDATLFAAKSATISGSTITYPSTTGNKVFTPGVVRFFEPYTINWEISFNSGITWSTVGASNNTLYVTKAAPYTPAGGVACNYETVFYLSCKNANNQTADTAIVSHVWTEFTDRIVLNAKGQKLYYYQSWDCPYTELSELLQYRDGECYTWAYLFLAALKVQGIAFTNNYAYVDSNYGSFLVKNNSFSSMVAANTYEYRYDLTGAPGQSTDDPPSNFNNHGIAKIYGVYYDPSYGVKYGTTIASMKAALDAFVGYYYYYTDLSEGTLYEAISTY